MKLRYSMVIRWSEADRAYLVELPELYGKGRYCTHGDTYEEAARKGAEVMDLLVRTINEDGEPTPTPALVPVESATIG